MGYDIVFRYHEKLEEGGYDKSVIKELRRKEGEPFEDISLEKLANTIFMQLARRDIFIVDVEIYEYTKTKINFRETKGGIVVKNKKFILDNEVKLVSEEIETKPAISQLPVPTNGSVANSNLSQPHNNLPMSQRRPIKHVALDGDLPTMIKVKQYNLQLTPGKIYPIFQEIPDPRDKRVDKFGNPTLDRKMIYVTIDDQKREITVSSDYFLPPDAKLIGGNFSRDKEPKLMYEGETGEKMPELRR